MKPLLKYAGSKRYLAPLLADVLPPARLYVEPFCGSCAVWSAYVEKHGKPHYAILTDANEPLVNLLMNVTLDPVGVLGGQNEWVHLYRSEDTDTNRAIVYGMARTDYNGDSRLHRRKVGQGRPDGTSLFLNRTCYNGLQRVNQKGEFNVPFGHYKKPAFLDADDMAYWHNVLWGPEIRCADFTQVLSELDGDPDMTIYLDPPYLNTFSSYHHDGFAPHQHVVLEALASRLARRGAAVVASNSLEAASLWEGWWRYIVSNRTSISRDANGRGKKDELLVTSWPLAPEIKRQHSIEDYHEPL